MAHMSAGVAAFLAAVGASDPDLLQVLAAGSCDEWFTRVAAFASLCPETQKDLDKLSSELEALYVRLQVLLTSVATQGHAGRRARLSHSELLETRALGAASAPAAPRPAPVPPRAAVKRRRQLPSAGPQASLLFRAGETALLARKVGGDP